jgi:hypothetical protein
MPLVIDDREEHEMTHPAIASYIARERIERMIGDVPPRVRRRRRRRPARA